MIDTVRRESVMQQVGENELDLALSRYEAGVASGERGESRGRAGWLPRGSSSAGGAQVRVGYWGEARLRETLQVRGRAEGGGRASAEGRCKCGKSRGRALLSSMADARAHKRWRSRYPRGALAPVASP